MTFARSKETYNGKGKNSVVVPGAFYHNATVFPANAGTFVRDDGVVNDSPNGFYALVQADRSWPVELNALAAADLGSPCEKPLPSWRWLLFGCTNPMDPMVRSSLPKKSGQMNPRPTITDLPVGIFPPKWWWKVRESSRNILPSLKLTNRPWK